MFQCLKSLFRFSPFTWCWLLDKVFISPSGTQQGSTIWPIDLHHYFMTVYPLELLRVSLLTLDISSFDTGSLYFYQSVCQIADLSSFLSCKFWWHCYVKLVSRILQSCSFYTPSSWTWTSSCIIIIIIMLVITTIISITIISDDCSRDWVHFQRHSLYSITINLGMSISRLRLIYTWH